MERFFEQAGAPVEERFLGWTAYFRPAALPDLLNGEIHPYVGNGQATAHAVGILDRIRSAALLHRLLYVNFLTYLPDDLHVKMDRMSMASGLETRSPLLDTALIEFAATLPAHLMIRHGRGKHLLRAAFSRDLPPAVLKRRKHGFGVPVGRWFRTDLRPAFEDVVLAPTSGVRDYLNQRTVRGIFHEHLRGTRDHGQRLWVLMNLGLWLQMLKRDVGWTPPDPEVSAREVR